MKKQFIFFLLALCINLSAQKGNFIMCHRQVSAVDETVIPESDYTLVKKCKLYYFLSNDNDNLYINIRVDDSGVQSKILNEGMTLWINLDGKNVRNRGIHYPIGANTARGTRAAIASGSPLAMANTIELLGFSDKPERFPSDNTDNIRGSVKYNSEGSLFYRMVVPLARLSLKDDPKNPGKLPFTLGIEYGLYPLAARPAGGGTAGTFSGMPSGGGRGGGRPGGGMTRSGAPGQGGAVSSPENPFIFWAKNVKLAEG